MLGGEVRACLVLVRVREGLAPVWLGSGPHPRP